MPKITGPTGRQKSGKVKKARLKEISQLNCMYTNCDTLLFGVTLIRVIIDGKFEGNEKLASDRQSRERNIVIFRMDEPQTNLVIERKAKDKEVVQGMIDHMGIETEEEVNIEKIIRLGGRSVNYKEKPRPVVVTFSNIDSKKNFLRRSNALKNSENETFKKVAVSNDLTKRDREKELELLSLRNQKNSNEVGPWKYVIRGPPGDRKLVKLRKQD